MIRKSIIVMLTLGAIMAGVLGLVGHLQGYLDPGRFYGASDRPALHWLQREFDLGSRLQIMVNSYVRGSLTIIYSSLSTRGAWYTQTNGLIRFPGLSVSTVRRCPISLSTSTGPPAGTIYQQAGWIITVPFLLIALLFGLYPLVALLRGPVRRWSRRQKGLCVTCAYDLTGNESGVCPECGKAVC